MMRLTLRGPRGRTTVAVPELPVTLSADVTERIVLDVGQPHAEQSYRGVPLDLTWSDDAYQLTLTPRGPLPATGSRGPQPGPIKQRVDVRLPPELAEWLRSQSGGASATVERLVREARGEQTERGE